MGDDWAGLDFNHFYLKAKLGEGLLNLPGFAAYLLLLGVIGHIVSLEQHVDVGQLVVVEVVRLGSLVKLSHDLSASVIGLLLLVFDFEVRRGRCFLAFTLFVCWRFDDEGFVVFLCLFVIQFLLIVFGRFIPGFVLRFGLNVVLNFFIFL